METQEGPDMYIQDLLKQPDFINASESKRSVMMEELLSLLAEKGLVESDYHFDKKNAMFSYRDANGYARGIMLRSFSKNHN